MADAAFAKPFGIPDGYIAVGLYTAMILLLFGPVEKLWIWIPLLVLASLGNSGKLPGRPRYDKSGELLFLLRADYRPLSHFVVDGVATALNWRFFCCLAYDL